MRGERGRMRGDRGRMRRDRGRMRRAAVMRTLTGAWLLLVLVVVNASAQETEDAPLNLAVIAPEARYDFLAGEWSYAFEQGEGTARYVAAGGGQPVREVVDGTLAGTPFVGTSLTWYDAEAGLWRRRWIDTLGNVIVAESTMRAYVESELPAMVSQFELDGVLYRHVWYDIRADRFETDLLVSQDGGESWQLARRMPYLRIR